MIAAMPAGAMMGSASAIRRPNMMANVLYRQSSGKFPLIVDSGASTVACASVQALRMGVCGSDHVMQIVLGSV